MSVLALAVLLGQLAAAPATVVAAPSAVPPTLALLPAPSAAVAPPQLLAAGQGSSSGVGLFAAGALLAALAGAAYWASRRRQAQPRHIQVIDTASLGPKRSLSLVVVNGQSLLLSCSEAGIALLSAQPVSASADAELAAPAQADFGPHLVNAEELQSLRARLAHAGAVGLQR